MRQLVGLAKDKFILVFTLLVIVIGLLFYVDYSPSNAMPIAHQGVLDAGKWNFSKQGVLLLNGQWVYYPSQFVDARKITSGQSKYSFLEVPRVGLNWGRPSGSSPWGYGTYRVTVDLNSSDLSMGMMLGSIQTSSRVFINGKLVYQSGVPGVSRSAYRPGDKPQEIFFHPSHGRITLVIQVANYDFYRTGIVSPIVLGTSQQIERMTFFNDGMDFAAMSIIGLFGVYYFALLWSLRRNRYRKYYDLLVLGVFFLAFSAEIPFEGANIVYKLVPSLPYGLYWKLKIILPAAMSLLILQYFGWILKPSRFRRLLIVPSGLFLGYVVATAILPVHVMARGEVIHFLMGLGLMTLVGILITLLIAYGRRRYGPFQLGEIRLYILAVLSLIVIDLNNVSYLNTLVDNNVITDITRVLFAGIMWSVLALRYYHSYSRMETATEKLKVMDRLKDDFFIQTAHELKTPLHGIVNILQAVMEKFSTQVNESAPDTQMQKLRLVQTTARRMSRTVNDIMDLARIREGRLDVHLTVVDLRSCLSLIEDLFVDQVQAKNLQMMHQIGDGAEFVKADEGRLIQVLTNLIHNSIKHTATGSILVTSEHKDRAVYISVEDTGMGISPPKQQVLFSPYERSDVDALTDDAGIGLGLHISRQLVQAMGGELFLAWSEVGKGARFTCRLPAVDVDMAVLAENLLQQGMHVTNRQASVTLQTSDYAQGGGPVILAVDDEVVNLEVLSGLFEGHDYKVVTASSGRSALRQISKHKPELVLLDVMLPDISGYEVCRVIRQTFSMIELPVLFLTVRNTAEDMERAFEVGGNDFIVKPFESREIRARVETLLTMKGLARAVVENEIAFLHAQIKPHFLYNALNTISALCDTDPDSARDVTDELALYLRSRFDFRNLEKLVPLEQELEYIYAYVNVEKARFGDRLTVEYNIEDGLHFLIPPLILQPLVENAVKHGLKTRVNGGRVTVSVKREDETLMIRVSDNGMGMSDVQVNEVLSAAAGKGVGLRNVDQRLKRLYGKGLSITSTLGIGTTVVVTIPWEPQDD
ncbi:ATP-binding protein [Alicyclobacillus sp. ALC3]|uniref:ATP-binding protein n=1 Tax=Alicyclobacillus sp. ALC3 TaxID=2796143 RepID=UPI002378EA4F|nr:ATP-binding protein [Alicyclobacillus sp. ALC3]WDL95642.1 response regulator [Alicyclobacillus sp. ALC3]